MRRLLSSWINSGSALLALSLLVGCAPPAEKPAGDSSKTTPEDKGVNEGKSMGTSEPAAEMPADERAGEDATPETDAAEERKDEAEAAGKDPLDTTSKDPSVKLGEPEDPVNLK